MVHDNGMLRWLVITAFMASASPCAAATQQPFFPPNYAGLSFSCSSENGAVSDPHEFLNKFRQDWFSQHLQAAGEAPLYTATPSNSAMPVLRFTWLRSFDPPVTVRLSKQKDGGWSLVAKQLSGKGGYDPGAIDKVVNRRISVSEAAALDALMARVTLPDLSGDCALGMDGAQWIIERSDAKGHHFINRFSPSDGPVRQVGLFLLNLTGWSLEPVY